MSAAATKFDDETLADLLRRLGNISPRRVRWHPTPGTATEKDLLRLERKTNRLCELVDGTLVEKAVGVDEAFLAMSLGSMLHQFIGPRNAGWLTGPDGIYRLFAGLIRMPDLAFVSWDRCPGRRRPRTPISPIVPDLAIEILSRKNTKAEMERKRREYFAAGVRLVWLVDPRGRTVQVYTAADKFATLRESDTLTGEPALPGFKLRLRELFAELDRHG